MTVIKILQYPDPRLKRVAKQVVDFKANDVQQMIDDMFETRYNTENCAALAATQLDFIDPYHITTIDISENNDQPLCLVNAKIINRTGETYLAEGCMSIEGGIYEKVRRAEKITVHGFDRHGEVLEITTDGFLAKCIQHELDHLNGIIFIDHLSRLKRQLVDKKFAKHQRHQ